MNTVRTHGGQIPSSAPIKRLSRSLALAWALSIAAGAVTPTLFAAKPDTRPNIIVILADDLGYSDVGCFGSEIATPAIDALASRGVRFTDFYTCSVCCPSRAALLTGVYPHQAGLGWMVLNGSDSRPPGPYQGYLNDHCVTIAEILKNSGYRTLMSGKWHVGEERPHWPVDRGFDRSFALISGASNYFDIAKDYIPGVKREMAIDGRPYTPPEGSYMTDAIADRAVAFVSEAANESRPFFLYLAFTAPHFPLHARAADIARNRGKYRRGWDDLRARRFDRMKELGLLKPDATLSPRDPGVPAWDDVRDQDIEDLKMAIYAAQIERMDAGIGRVMKALKECHRDQNTFIIFLSDNGGCAADLSRFRPKHLNQPPFLGGPDSYIGYGMGWANASNTPLRKFKTFVHEGGIAAPMIMAGPGIRPGGAIRREPAHVIDLMATLLELSDSRYPDRQNGKAVLPFEGESLVAALQGKNWRRQRPLFWEFEGNFAMREGRWKLLGKEGGPWALFDLENDREESRDLAAQNEGRIRSMSARFQEWTQRCGVESWKKIGPTMQNIPGIK